MCEAVNLPCPDSTLTAGSCTYGDKDNTQNLTPPSPQDAPGLAAGSCKESNMYETQPRARGLRSHFTGSLDQLES